MKRIRERMDNLYKTVYYEYRLKGKKGNWAKKSSDCLVLRVEVKKGEKNPNCRIVSNSGSDGQCTSEFDSKGFFITDDDENKDLCTKNLNSFDYYKYNFNITRMKRIRERMDNLYKTVYYEYRLKGKKGNWAKKNSDCLVLRFQVEKGKKNPNCRIVSTSPYNGKC
uniref:Astacin domain-containing protein n=1 Tax=Strongyloides papillosus TaxID=174720 RepID=A0A0N5C6B3_STREA